MRIDEERLRLDKSAGPHACWPSAWAPGSLYPRLYVNGVTTRVAVLAHELFKGPVPTGAVIVNTCGNARCCNPAHLMAGTIQDAIDVRERRYAAPGGGKSVISDDMARQIWVMAVINKIPMARIAQFFSINYQTVSNIKCGRSHAKATAELRAAQKPGESR